MVDENTGDEVGYTLTGIDVRHNETKPAPHYRIYFDRQEPQDSAIVSYVVTNPNNGAVTQVNCIVVRPQFTLRPVLEFYEVPHGQSINLYVEALNQCGVKFPNSSFWQSILPVSTTYNASIISGAEFGILVNTATSETGTTLSGLPHDQVDGRLSSLIFVANGEALSPSSTDEVRFQISTSDARIEPIEFSIRILPSIVDITFVPPVVAPGDTAAIILKKFADGGTKEDFPPGQLFEIGIIQGGNYGTILSPIPSPLSSDYFLDFEQPFQFIAAESIDLETVVVRVRVGIPEEIQLMVPSGGQAAHQKSGREGNRVLGDIPESDFVYTDFGIGTLVIRQLLDHFAVTVVPDTIEHNETTTLIVQAKDKNDNDITLPDNTLLDFALDAAGDLLGNFIAPDGSQAKSLAGIRYSEASAGNVKYIANGEKPELTQEVLITVSKSDDATKSGTGNVVVEAMPKLTIAIPDPDEIWPTLPADQGGNPGNRNRKDGITVELTRGDQPVVNQDITITAQMIVGSGGHNHEEAGALQTPPDNSLGIFSEGTETGTGTITRPTDANGQIQLRYEAPIFGGEIELIATTVIDGEPLEVRAGLVVRVPGLQLLEDNANYVKIGGRCNHHGPRNDGAFPNCRAQDNNHFGVPNTVASLQRISAAYRNAFPDDPILQINDMSLPSGGRFDINGRWAGNNNHEYHRLGIDVDVRSATIPEGDRYRDINGNRMYDLGEPLTRDVNGNGRYDRNRDSFQQICLNQGAFEVDLEFPGVAGQEHYHVYYWNRNQ